MKEIRRSDLDKPVQEALKEVESTLSASHCPYSGLQVAAGLLLEDGSVVTGVNYESASYGLTLCAERAALVRAQAEGSISRGVALLLAARRAGEERPGRPITPCGACRQWILELSARLGRELPVYAFPAGGESGLTDTPGNLLPDAFL
ncbi:MAG: cytidine deaminase [Oceanipulchritudo sp.]|jgi:cytidine deaminase